MGLMPSHIRMFIKMQKKYKFSGNVCVLGNQEIWATKEDIKHYCNEAEHTYKNVKQTKKHTSRLFKSNSDLSELANDFIHAKTFFEMMGFDKYIDVDNFKYDQPALLHDMNLPIPKSMHNQFDLVFDGGTVEHIFDISKVMENLIKMVSINGCVIHLASYDMDHGFYGLSPCFFYDFYKANGFSNFSCYIMATDYSNVLEKYKERRPYFKYEYGMDLSCLLSASSSWLIFFSAQKIKNHKVLSIPTQGMFEPSEGQNLRQSKSIFRDSIPLFLQPLLISARPLLRKLNKIFRCWKVRRSLLKDI